MRLYWPRLEGDYWDSSPLSVQDFPLVAAQPLGYAVIWRCFASYGQLGDRGNSLGSCMYREFALGQGIAIVALPLLWGWSGLRGCCLFLPSTLRLAK